MTEKDVWAVILEEARKLQTNKRDNEVTVKEFATMIGSGKETAVKVLDKLIEMELVKRRKGQHNAWLYYPNPDKPS